MPPYETADPRPFAFGDGPTGCLLLHGFTGSPAEVRPLGAFLADQGMRVSGPLLPGHGVEPEDLNQVRWQEWVLEADEALMRLTRVCSRVWVGGLSMGALVAAMLAATRGDVSGLLAYAPALRASNRLLPFAVLMQHFIRQFPTDGDTDLTDPEAPARLWHYETRPVGGAAQLWRLQREVRPMLTRITAPALVVHSTRDRAVHPRASERFFALLGSPRKTYAVYANSGHCMLVDSEREAIFAETWQFITSQ